MNKKDSNLEAEDFTDVTLRDLDFDVLLSIKEFDDDGDAAIGVQMLVEKEYGDSSILTEADFRTFTKFVSEFYKKLIDAREMANAGEAKTNRKYTS